MATCCVSLLPLLPSLATDSRVLWHLSAVCLLPWSANSGGGDGGGRDSSPLSHMQGFGNYVTSELTANHKSYPGKVNASPTSLLHTTSIIPERLLPGREGAEMRKNRCRRETKNVLRNVCFYGLGQKLSPVGGEMSLFCGHPTNHRERYF